MSLPMFRHALRAATSVGLFAAIAINPSETAAQPACELPVHAYLTDDAGAALDGSVDIEFRFYTEVGPEAVPAECRSYGPMTTDAGWLRVSVDACGDPDPGDCGTSPLVDLFADGATNLWIGVFLDGEETGPRITMGSVPFALRAASAGDAATLDGLGPDAFESAGALSAHAGDPDAHHSSTSEGIDITPASVRVGETVVNDGRVDLGVDADDELTTVIVQTLTGGGDADALHSHASSGGSGGACLVAWGRSDCPADFTLFYAGRAVQGYGAHRDYGSSDTLTMALGETLCADPDGLPASETFTPTNYTQGLIEVGGTTRYQGTGLACAVCCR